MSWRLPSVDIFEKGWIKVTKFKLFRMQSSSANGEHVDPMSGDEKTFCISSFGVRRSLELAKFIIFSNPTFHCDYITQSCHNIFENNI